MVLIVHYMKMGASGEYYDARRSEEGDGGWGEHDLCAVFCVIKCMCATKPSALSKPYLLLLHKCCVNSQPISKFSLTGRKRELRSTKEEDNIQAPTFEGDENTWCCQWLVEDGVPQSKAGQGQEGVDRPQTVQLHLWATSCGARGLILSNLCGDNRWLWEFLDSVHKCDGFV